MRAATTVIPRGRLTTEQVMERLGKERRTLQDLAKAGRLRFDTVPGKTRPMRLYYEEDVAKLEGGDTLELRARKGEKQASGAMEALATLATAVVYEADARREEREEDRLHVPIHLKLWLTFYEAAAYSGFGVEDLKRLCAAGKLITRRTGRRLVIERASLEGFQG